MNMVSLQEAKELFTGFCHVIKGCEQIAMMGIHGSIATNENGHAKDADYILMMKNVKQPIGIDTNAKKVANEIVSEICQIVGGKLHNKYVCENLNLLGYSLITKHNKKLSFHFVSLNYCEESIRAIVCYNQKLDCIFNTEMSPTKIYRLWVKDTIELFDNNRVFTKMKEKDVQIYHETMRPYIEEHFTSAVNQYNRCHDDTSRFLLRQSAINAAILLMYAINKQFYGAPKKLNQDLVGFSLEKDACQGIRKLLGQADNTEQLFTKMISSMRKIIVRVG